jgi:hypothetical protein
MNATDWLPRSPGNDTVAERYERAARWEECCWTRYEAAREMFASARAELEDSKNAYEAAAAELSRAEYLMKPP